MTPKGEGRTVVFDFEGNDLYPAVSRLHCLVAIDVATRECFSWRPWELEDGIRFLAECFMVIGHNVLDYDLRAAEKLFPWFKRPAKVRDTLIMSRVVWPADILIGPDMALAAKGKLPRKWIKSHALGAWGHRLGNFKGDYHGPWDVWSEEMHEYMIQDAWVNLDLYERILRKVGWLDPKPGVYVWPELPFEIEHGVARIILEQQETGFNFDREAAIALAKDLTNRRAEINERLVEHFGSWNQPTDDPERGYTPPRSYKRKRSEFPDVRLPRYSEKTGKRLADYVGPPLEQTTEGCPFVRFERITFSPSSRHHLSQRLQEVYGWRPRRFGKDGKPTLDEDTLAEIPEEVLPADLRGLLQEYFKVEKVLGIVSKGQKSWLHLLGDDGRIHGKMNTAGAITSRGTHYAPNVTLTPKVQKDDDTEAILHGFAGGYGWECRSCFIPSAGNEETGTDAASLELITLGHYMAPYDGGKFSERVCDPTRDAHTEHAEITGENRDDTKTVTYASVYGGGAWKIGLGLALADGEVEALLTYPKLDWLIKNKMRMDGKDFVPLTRREAARLAKGHRVLNAFMNGVEGIKPLKEAVTAAGSRGWLKGLDGRQVYIRKAHASLNALLQSAGAIICKLWMIIVHEKLEERGIAHLAHQVLWAHDELQFDHAPGLGPTIGEISLEAIRETGERLGLRGALRSEAKTGHSWAECH